MSAKLPPSFSTRGLHPFYAPVTGSANFGPDCDPLSSLVTWVQPHSTWSGGILPTQGPVQGLSRGMPGAQWKPHLFIPLVTGLSILDLPADMAQVLLYHVLKGSPISQEEVFTCWKQSGKTGRGICSFKCKDNSSRLYGSWQIRHTWYHQRKLVKCQ